MGMNQKTAYKILGLGPGASLGQAKKAFRDLAKKYHPDRYPSCSQDTCSGGEIRAVQAEARMDRMKQINQAFHLLAPLLASADGVPDKAPTAKAFTDTPPISPGKKTSGKTDFGFLDILRLFKKGIKLKFYRKADSQPRPSVKQPLNSNVPGKNRAGQAPRFSTILNTLHPGDGFGEKSRNHERGKRIKSSDSRIRTRASNIQPYGSYLKYMVLKKKIDARAGRHGQQNFDRIEKIRPVTRVNPLGDKK